MRFSAIFLQLGVSSVLGQQLTKPAAWPNLDQFRDMLNVLPRQSTHFTAPITPGEITKGCRDRVLLDGRDPTKFHSHIVIYGDVSARINRCPLGNKLIPAVPGPLGCL